MSDWLADLRPGHGNRRLIEEHADADPLRQFRTWLDQAHEAGIPQPNAMTLSTVDEGGAPDARVVLLKAFDARGFVFYTHRTSHKGRQLEGRRQAALTFWWDPLERQVRIRGDVEQTSDEESDEYFLSRPRGSQLSAIVSAQSTPVSRADLEQALTDLDTVTAGRPLARPASWGGYRVLPSTIEFWQGRPNRLHDRLHYTRTPDGWQRQRLAP